jgi:hypothetical protein
MNSHGSDGIQAAFKTVIAHPTFFTEMADTLASFSDLPVSSIDICLRFQHLVIESEIGLLEETDEVKRVQWMKLSPPSDKSIITHWYWDIDDECN